ncbi:MAG: acetyl-CoA carboxylase biotin carboxylase subunit [Gammaproteobacteria bacterium]|nr:MAG: acetyl-CoA carboxylase biotin carboxylase subunit [Gammaproteobacteria bacterium]
MLTKLLIANRGEIALRIHRACKELNIPTVAVYSEADRDLMHVKLADESICIGPAASSESYLNIPAIISAMELSGADGVHPGYGFLAENADFAEKIEKSGFEFAGPSSEIIKTMGNKISAKKLAKEIGLPIVPGSSESIGSNAREEAEKIGYPIIIKAASGGGGRGMRVVNSESELENSLNLTRSEAEKAFGDQTVYMEKFFTSPRHIEVQVLGDKFGNVIHLGERDCSLQRRHQKVIEEAPALGIPQEAKEEIYSKCIEACKKIKYVSAGTFEFLYENEKFYFMEMNTRIQVEHPVTESVTGLDLVKLQLRIARGEKLKIKQEDVVINGHAIECRINAEHPKTFMPSPGKVIDYHAPGGIGVRIDSHLYNGYVVPPHYDSLIAKLIVRANEREDARVRLVRAIEEMVISGIDTNLEMHTELLKDEKFSSGDFDINYLENKYKDTNKNG